MSNASMMKFILIIVNVFNQYFLLLIENKSGRGNSFLDVSSLGTGNGRRRILKLEKDVRISISLFK